MVMKRTGGMIETLPEIMIWVRHKIVGHPVNKLVKPQYSTWAWCSECGAGQLLAPKDET